MLATTVVDSRSSSIVLCVLCGIITTSLKFVHPMGPMSILPGREAPYMEVQSNPIYKSQTQDLALFELYTHATAFQ